jgi:hypothetical protein
MRQGVGKRLAQVFIFVAGLFLEVLLLLVLLPIAAFALVTSGSRRLWRRLELWALFDGVDADHRDRDEWKRR